MGDSSISAMIRRFREAEPSSRVDRETKRRNGDIKEMWWIDSDKVRNDSPLENEDDYDINILPRKAPHPVEFSSNRSILDGYPLTSRDLYDPMHYEAQSKFDIDDAIRTSIALPRDWNRDITPLTSIEKLGDSGFRSLLSQELRLDGRRHYDLTVESENVLDEKIPDLDLKKGMDELQELIKNLGEVVHRNESINICSSIQDVSHKLETDLAGFKARFHEKIATEENIVSHMSAHDEEMKEVGRREERQKQLLRNFDEININADSNTHRLSFFKSIRSKITGEVAHDGSKDVEAENIRFQVMLDNEINVADETCKSMRFLRTQLLNRMKMLNNKYEHVIGSDKVDSSYDRGHNKIRSSIVHDEFIINNDRKELNIFPDLIHQNLISVSKGISSDLDSVMTALNLRLTKEQAINSEPIMNHEFLSSIAISKQSSSLENDHEAESESSVMESNIQDVQMQPKQGTDNFVAETSTAQSDDEYSSDKLSGEISFKYNSQVPKKRGGGTPKPMSKHNNFNFLKHHLNSKSATTHAVVDTGLLEEEPMESDTRGSPTAVETQKVGKQSSSMNNNAIFTDNNDVKLSTNHKFIHFKLKMFDNQLGEDKEESNVFDSSKVGHSLKALNRYVPLTGGGSFNADLSKKQNQRKDRPDPIRLVAMNSNPNFIRPPIVIKGSTNHELAQRSALRGINISRNDSSDADSHTIDTGHDNTATQPSAPPLPSNFSNETISNNFDEREQKLLAMRKMREKMEFSLRK